MAITALLMKRITMSTTTTMMIAMTTMTMMVTIKHDIENRLINLTLSNPPRDSAYFHVADVTVSTQWAALTRTASSAVRERR